MHTAPMGPILFLYLATGALLGPPVDVILPENMTDFVAYEVVTVPSAQTEHDPNLQNLQVPTAVFTYMNRTSDHNAIVCTHVVPFRSSGNYSNVAVESCSSCIGTTSVTDGQDRRSDNGCCLFSVTTTSMTIEAKTGDVFRTAYHESVPSGKAANSGLMYLQTGIVDRSLGQNKDYKLLCGIVSPVKTVDSSTQSMEKQSWQMAATNSYTKNDAQCLSDACIVDTSDDYFFRRVEDLRKEKKNNKEETNRVPLDGQCCRGGQIDNDCGKQKSDTNAAYLCGSASFLYAIGELDAAGPVVSLAVIIRTTHQQQRLGTMFVVVNNFLLDPKFYMQTVVPGIIFLKNTNEERRLWPGSRIFRTGRFTTNHAPVYAVHTYIRRCAVIPTAGGSAASDCAISDFFSMRTIPSVDYEWYCENKNIVKVSSTTSYPGDFRESIEHAATQTVISDTFHVAKPLDINGPNTFCSVPLTAFSAVLYNYAKGWFSDDTFTPNGMIDAGISPENENNLNVLQAKFSTDGLVTPKVVENNDFVPMSFIVTRETEVNDWDAFGKVNDVYGYKNVSMNCNVHDNDRFGYVYVPGANPFKIHTNKPCEVAGHVDDDYTGELYNAFMASTTNDGKTVALTYANNNTHRVAVQFTESATTTSTVTSGSTTTSTLVPCTQPGFYRQPEIPHMCVECPVGKFKRLPLYGSQTSCLDHTNCKGSGMLTVWEGNTTSDAICAVDPKEHTCPPNEWLDGTLSIEKHVFTFKCFANASACPWAGLVNETERGLNYSFSADNHMSGDQVDQILNFTERFYANNTTNASRPMLIPLCNDVRNCTAPKLYVSRAPTPSTDRQCSYCGCIDANDPSIPTDKNDDGKAIIDLSKCKYGSGPIPTSDLSGSTLVADNEPKSHFAHTQCLIAPADNIGFCCPFNYSRITFYEKNAPDTCVSYETSEIPAPVNADTETCGSTADLEQFSTTTTIPPSPTSTSTTTVLPDTHCQMGEFINTSATPQKCSVCPDGQYNDQNQSTTTSCYPVPDCSPTEVRIYPENDTYTKMHGSICGAKDNVCAHGEYTIGYAGNLDASGTWGIRESDLPPGISINDLAKFSITRNSSGFYKGLPRIGPVKTVRYVRLCAPWKNCSAEDNEYEVTSPTENTNRECAACPILRRENTTYVGSDESCNRRRASNGAYSNVVADAECMGVTQKNQKFCCRYGYDRSQFSYSLTGLNTTCTIAEWKGSLLASTTTSTLTSTSTVTTQTTASTTTTTTPFRVKSVSSLSTKEEQGLGYAFFGVALVIVTVISIFKIRSMVRVDASYRRLDKEKRRK